MDDAAISRQRPARATTTYGTFTCRPSRNPIREERLARADESSQNRRFAGYGFRVLLARVVLALSLVVGAATPSLWAATTGAVTVTKAIQGALTTVDAGVEFTYLINYAYASTTENGQNVTLVDFLDSDLSWTTAQVIPGTTIHIASTTYDQATGKGDLELREPVAGRIERAAHIACAVSAGDHTARLPWRRTPPPWTAITPTSKTSNEVSISATATCKWVANVTRTG